MYRIIVTMINNDKNKTIQSSNWHRQATPLLIQCCWDFFESSVVYITKFVECPVVESTPRLALVLYTGHSYHGLGIVSDLTAGFSHIIGTVSNRIFGNDSSKMWRFRSHLAPSRNSPWKEYLGKKIRNLLNSYFLDCSYSREAPSRGYIIMQANIWRCLLRHKYENRRQGS